jgi:hypothetical protein
MTRRFFGWTLSRHGLLNGLLNGPYVLVCASIMIYLVLVHCIVQHFARLQLVLFGGQCRITQVNCHQHQTAVFILLRFFLPFKFNVCPLVSSAWACGRTRLKRVSFIRLCHLYVDLTTFLIACVKSSTSRPGRYVCALLLLFLGVLTQPLQCGNQIGSYSRFRADACLRCRRS